MPLPERPQWDAWMVYTAAAVVFVVAASQAAVLGALVMLLSLLLFVGTAWFVDSMKNQPAAWRRFIRRLLSMSAHARH
ncbi:MAG: hypothetical protein ICV59_02150 [Thermoleophilia bacterium]|nr:hypothetical protein [Thermoleophilia bacterium]